MLYLFVFSQSERKTADALLLDVLQGLMARAARCLASVAGRKIG
ncbi:hypothetical protein ABID16_004061 [Rhizobium aquaticum]|uniref:Transposase n=1 Tax=Rhizobium aquaticum TaxID=1549636 RepID=A0ABV2J7F5_9HYPH